MENTEAVLDMSVHETISITSHSGVLAAISAFSGYDTTTHSHFEGGYRPTRLANWEVGRVHQERPRQRRGTTRVIADDRGHLLPGVARSQATPWGPLTQALGEDDRLMPHSGKDDTIPSTLTYISTLIYLVLLRRKYATK
ncbi:Protein Flattop [Portunus trituberculatus]|uniref:Cilia- and flagella-associated protein 126 n=1 Tax=Portunus trituberculatus TaxID=210409 RepID=A0A5B7G135_PORTR|nr:Protein Flattop [Portunus trituberculatus]